MNPIALDIQTTGPDSRRDEIIEIAAVEIVDGKIGGSFASVVEPAGAIPLQVLKTCGIAKEEFRKASPLEDVLDELVEFIAGRPCIIHDLRSRQRFLEAGNAASRLRSGASFIVHCASLIDTLELCHVLLPMEECDELEHLARKYNFEFAEPVRALAGATLTAKLWQALLAELDELPFPVLNAIMGLVQPVEWELKGLFAEVHARKFAESFGKTDESITSCIADVSAVIVEAGEKKSKRQKDVQDAADVPPPVPLNPTEIMRMFGPEGVFAKHLTNFEPRREQARMAKAVAYCLNNAKHLMVEAGTGTGKSLAYLVPAVYWATTNKTPVVISTCTRNLQAQLFFKDIPMLKEMLERGFRAALIKGRANYLCTRKLLYLLSEAEREIGDAERIALLPIITWAAMTQTGDISENTGFQVSRAIELWDRLYAKGDECRGRACNQWKRCFLLKARALSQLADIVVANHAVVFAELGIGSSTVLPEHRHLIFDEAHDVESVATENLGCEIDRWLVLRALNRLYRVRERDKSGRGLLTNILYQLRRGRETNPSDTELSIERKLSSAFEKITDLGAVLESFLESLGGLFEQGRGGGRGSGQGGGESRGESRLRYSGKDRPADKWQPIFRQKELFVMALTDLIQELESAIEDVNQLQRQFLYQQDLIFELESQLNVLREIVNDTEFLMKGDDAGYVYWVECEDTRQGGFRAAAAPIEVGKLLKDLLYEKKDTIVFSSATLTVGEKFDFFRSRLGLDLLEQGRALELSLGTSFDFERQVLFCVPNFLPEPVYGSNDFTEAVAKFIADLHRASRGRGLILFTSFDMLNKTYPIVKDDLEQAGIPVLGQGVDGTPDQILRAFRRVYGSVLLGTQSFWEGVDVPGEALSCLTVAKLPFAVFTDPIIKARCEAVEAKGQSSFVEFSVPMAVIRFKQGFGRLIRSKADRGVVVVLDKRLITQRYGRYFLGSVPVTHRVYSDRQRMLTDVTGFLEIQIKN
ncbi:MAG TPA: helicase C-terminal domain-containing protein [Planctomycetota bacterium]|nr:helicase C-terminal domain-containing protein [Planctomycetota bacterium]